MIYSVFADLMFYIKCMVSGNQAALIKYKELSVLFNTFKSSKYKYILKDKKITNLFLQKVYGLYKSTSLLKSMFESSIFSTDDKKAAIFLNYFIDVNSPPEISSKKERFTKEAMWQKMVESENATKTMKTIEDEFNMYKNFFTKVRMPKFEQDYSLMYKLYQLSTFNFELFFSKFDHEFNPNSDVPPNHTPLHGEEILNDIKDLYFLITSLPPKTDLAGAFGKLFIRINEENYKTYAKNCVTAVNNTYKIIQDELAQDKLITLARYISEDPKLKIPVEQKSFSILERYRKEVEERFVKSKELILQKYSEQSQIHEIKDLIKDKSLLHIEGYTEELVEALDKNNFDHIAGIQALKITKTFIFYNYEQTIKETINSFILEAFFNEKDYQTAFSNKFFAANEILEFFKNFEESLSGGGSNSLKQLFLMFSKNGVTNELKVKRMIEILNEKIEGCNKKCAEVFYAVGVKIYEILQDYKAPKPLKINNIKTIKGVQNKEFMNQLAACYNDIAKYIKIVKNFINVDTSAKK